MPPFFVFLLILYNFLSQCGHFQILDANDDEPFPECFTKLRIMMGSELPYPKDPPCGMSINRMRKVESNLEADAKNVTFNLKNYTTEVWINGNVGESTLGNWQYVNYKAEIDKCVKPAWPTSTRTFYIDGCFECKFDEYYDKNAKVEEIEIWEFTKCSATFSSLDFDNFEVESPALSLIKSYSKIKNNTKFSLGALFDNGKFGRKLKLSNYLCYWCRYIDGPDYEPSAHRYRYASLKNTYFLLVTHTCSYKNIRMHQVIHIDQLNFAVKNYEPLKIRNAKIKLNPNVQKFISYTNIWTWAIDMINFDMRHQIVIVYNDSYNAFITKEAAKKEKYYRNSNLNENAVANYFGTNLSEIAILQSPEMNLDQLDDLRDNNTMLKSKANFKSNSHADIHLSGNSSMAETTKWGHSAFVKLLMGAKATINTSTTASYIDSFDEGNGIAKLSKDKSKEG